MKKKTERLLFRLYVTDRTTKSVTALRNLKAICDEYLRQPYDIEVVDLLVHPERAAADNIVAVPTLRQVGANPERRIVGDLSNRGRTLAWLGLDPLPPEARVA